MSAALDLWEIADVCGVDPAVCEAFLREFAPAWSFELGGGGLSLVVRSDLTGRIVGQVRFYHYPYPIAEPSNLHENWVMVMGFLIGLRQGGAK